MNLNLTKKNVIIVIGIAIIIILTITLIFIYKSYAPKYPKENVSVTTLGKSEKEIDINQIVDFEYKKDIPLYEVKQKIHLETIQSFISKLNLNLTKTETTKDKFYEWKDDNNYISYNTVTERISFSIGDGIKVSIEDTLFKSFLKNYFNLDFEYSQYTKNTYSNGMSTYYGPRSLDGIDLEYSNLEEYTDKLTIDTNGYIYSGDILLAEIEKSEYSLPLISNDNINKYINLEEYPKEVAINTSVLMSTLDIDYVSSDWVDIIDSADNCKANNVELIYLYKNSDQQYLTPTYKYSSTCTVKYKETEYSVPAIFYVNAIDPEYVSQ